MMCRGQIPSGGRLRRVGIVDRAKVDASAADGNGVDASVVDEIAVDGIVVWIAAEIVVRIVAQPLIQGGTAATTGRMLCGSGLHRVERVRRRVGMRSLT